MNLIAPLHVCVAAIYHSAPVTSSTQRRLADFAQLLSSPCSPPSPPPTPRRYPLSSSWPCHSSSIFCPAVIFSLQPPPPPHAPPLPPSIWLCHLSSKFCPAISPPLLPPLIPSCSLSRFTKDCLSRQDRVELCAGRGILAGQAGGTQGTLCCLPQRPWGTASSL